MDKFRFDKTLPAILGQICLWAFLQKFVYGYILRSPGTWQLSGLTLDYFIVFPCLILVCAFALSGFVARAGAVVRKPAVVGVAGGVATLACPALVFDGAGSLGGAAGLLLEVGASVALCLSFCVILFAWLGRMQRQAQEVGVRGVVLSSLVAYLVYCVIAPSYSNYTPYVLVLEVVALPAAALTYVLAERYSAVPASASRPLPEVQGMGRGSHRDGCWCLAASALLFAGFLGASYVDFLNRDLPVEHMEQPTFYALLIFGVVMLIASLLWEADSRHLTGRHMMATLGVMLAFFSISFMVVFFYAGASGRFCFDFTCALRRLVIIAGFVTALGIALSWDMRVDVSVTVGFFLPFLGVRAAMRTLGLQVSFGLLAGSADERLACMLVLGCVVIAGCAVAAVALGHVLQEGGTLGRTGARGLTSDVTGTFRASAVEALGDDFGLSVRERQILGYLSAGYSVSRMAELLGISENTVGTHVRSVYKKTGLHTKQEVIDAVAETQDRRE